MKSTSRKSRSVRASARKGLLNGSSNPRAKLKSTKRVTRRPPSGVAPGVCHRCCEKLEPAAVDVYRRRGDRHVLFRNVPARVCRACGERVFGPAEVEHMEATLAAPSTSRRKEALEIIAG